MPLTATSARNDSRSDSRFINDTICGFVNEPIKIRVVISQISRMAEYSKVANAADTFNVITVHRYAALYAANKTFTVD